MVILILSIKLQELPNINPSPSIELLTVILLEIFEFVFNIFVIVIFDVDNAFSIASIWIFENVIVSFTTFSNPYMLRLTLVFCCPIDTTLLKFSILIP